VKVVGELAAPLKVSVPRLKICSKLAPPWRRKKSFARLAFDARLPSGNHKPSSPRYPWLYLVLLFCPENCGLIDPVVFALARRFPFQCGSFSVDVNVP